MEAAQPQEATAPEAWPSTIGLHRFRIFLNVVQVLALAIAQLAGLGALYYDDLRLAIFWAAGTVYGFSHGLARRKLDQGRPLDALRTASLLFIAVVFVILTVYPGLYPAIIFVPFIIVVAAFSLTTGRAFQRVAWSAWSAIVAATLIGLLLPGRPGIPAWFDGLLIFICVSAASGVSVLLLTFTDQELREANARDRAAQQRLRVANARLRELDDMKTQFLNQMAHELSTPLTPLLLQLHLLKKRQDEGTPDPQDREAVLILERNLERFQTLVKEVLDVARLQGGGIRLDEKEFDLSDAVRESLHAYTPVAKAKGIRLIDEGLAPAVVRGDRTRLAQVIDNLLANAMKFTPPGGKVAVRGFADNGQATCEVQDTGTGLSPQQQARLFEPFTQVHDPSRSAEGGMGLGLYICRGILEAQGGTIRVRSDGPGKGSTFTFTVPLAMPAA